MSFSVLLCDSLNWGTWLHRLASIEDETEEAVDGQGSGVKAMGVQA